MNKLVLAACSLVLGGMMMTGCSKDTPSPKPTPAPVMDGHQKEAYAALGRLVTVSSGTDGIPQEVSGIVQALSPSLAVGFDFQKDIQMQWGDWATMWRKYKMTEAQDGMAGVLPKNNDMSKKVVVDPNGVEIAQLFKKGAIGAYTFANVLKQISMIGMPNSNNQSIYQNIVAYYLGGYDYLNMPQKEEMNEGMKIMAYQYVDGCEFAKYVNTVNNMEAGKGLGDKFIMMLKESGKMLNNNTAFKHCLLEAQDLAQQIIMVRASFYLKSGINKYGDGGLNMAFHNTSEALGFLYAMQFSCNPKTMKPYFSHEELTGVAGSLDLWKKDSALAMLKAFKQRIDATFSIDDSKLPAEE